MEKERTTEVEADNSLERLLLAVTRLARVSSEAYLSDM